MQVSTLLLLKCIVFALSNGVTYTDRQGRYIRRFQLIAKMTSLMGISILKFFLKMNVIMTTTSECRNIYFKYIFQSSGKSRGSWGTLKRLDSGKEMETRRILGPMAAYDTDLDKSWGYPCAFSVLTVPEQTLRHFLRAAVVQQQLVTGCAAHAFDRWSRRRRRRLLRACFPEERVWNMGHTSGQQLILHRITELNSPCASDVVLSAGVCS